MKLIIQGKTNVLVKAETTTDLNFPLNQRFKATWKHTALVEIKTKVVYLYMFVMFNIPEDIERNFSKIKLIKTR